MKNTGHYYAVTRVHSHELELLTKSDMNQLIETKSLKDCFALLSNKGWGSASLLELDSYSLLQYETNKTWRLMEELIGSIEPFNVFRYSHDYNNLKATIKLNYTHQLDGDIERYFMPYGTVPIEELINAVRNNNFSELPGEMAKAGEEASKVLSHTANGQNCDIVLDNYALKSIYQAAEESGNKLLMDYATLTVDLINIKTAIRSHKMNKDKGFLDRTIVECGSLNKELLIAAALDGKEAIYEYIKTTVYHGAVDELEFSTTAFERWCHNHLMASIQRYRHAIDGLEPLAAYILARENEIGMVKIILSAKTNSLDRNIIDERMREMYV